VAGIKTSNMKIVILFFALHVPFLIQAQSLKSVGHAGIAIGKNDFFKKIMLYKSNSIGYEKWIGYNLYLNFELGYSNLQYDDIDLSMNKKYFRTKNYLFLPLTIKKYYTLSRNSTSFIEIGFANNYNYKDKIEYSNNIVDSVHRNLGYTLSFLGRFGLKTKLINAWFMDIGMGSQDDIFQHYKDNRQELIAKRRFLILSVYRKLGK
jgi:hypothetical protein